MEYVFGVVGIVIGVIAGLTFSFNLFDLGVNRGTIIVKLKDGWVGQASAIKEIVEALINNKELK